VNFLRTKKTWDQLVEAQILRNARRRPRDANHADAASRYFIGE